MNNNGQENESQLILQSWLVLFCRVTCAVAIFVFFFSFQELFFTTFFYLVIARRKNACPPPPFLTPPGFQAGNIPRG